MKTLRHLLACWITLTCMAQAGDTLAVGDKAPGPVVELDDGSKVTLANWYSKGPVLVYFYPRSFTGGCTKQACNLRDSFSGIKAEGLTILGVSADDVPTQGRFRKEHNLPFQLVADTENALSKAFKVPLNPRGWPGRQSFLIVDGKIAWMDLRAKPASQAQDALKALKGVQSGS